MRRQGLALKSPLQATATPSLDRRWHNAVQLNPEIIKRARSLGRPVIVGPGNSDHGHHKDQSKQGRDQSQGTLMDRTSGHTKTNISVWTWSERQDLNLRPLAPQASALPGCATLRQELPLVP
jgi:hypothetical protein